MKNLKLKANADTTHEDARDWYSGYGAHVSTDHHGDITHDAVEYDWLDEDDDAVAAKLMEHYDKMTDDEAQSLAALARRVREAAESVVGNLEAAVEAYEAGDLDAVVEALDAASSEESDHGDDPASKSLRAALIEECDEEEAE